MKTIMFASAIYPAVISFYISDENNKNNSSTPTTSSVDPSSGNNNTDASASASASVTEPQKVYKVIFKSGDDLRQDQLVMQMMNLMDGLLKKVNLDLKVPHKPVSYCY